jgi:hypothetical protein
MTVSQPRAIEFPDEVAKRAWTISAEQNWVTSSRALKRAGRAPSTSLIQAIRPKPVRLMTRFEGLLGEFSQHDFGQVDVRFLNGSIKRTHFFASRLKYSAGPR